MSPCPVCFFTRLLRNTREIVPRCVIIDLIYLKAEGGAGTVIIILQQLLPRGIIIRNVLYGALAATLCIIIAVN